MYAEFTDDLITKNEMIDSQHRELISKINDLLISCENKSDKEGAVKMIGYLSDYTDFHFGAEEKLQLSIGYPGYEEHKAKHAELKKSVQELKDMLAASNGPTAEFEEKVKTEVLEWLLYHIKGFDRSVAEYKFMRDNPDML